MKIINTATNEVVASIIGGNNLTLDEAINIFGEIVNDMRDERFSYDGDNVIIGGERYWYEDLAMVAD